MRLNSCRSLPVDINLSIKTDQFAILLCNRVARELCYFIFHFSSVDLVRSLRWENLLLLSVKSSRERCPSFARAHSSRVLTKTDGFSSVRPTPFLPINRLFHSLIPKHPYHPAQLLGEWFLIKKMTAVFKTDRSNHSLKLYRSISFCGSCSVFSRHVEF